MLRRDHNDPVQVPQYIEDIALDFAKNVHPAFSSRRKAVVSHLQSRSHFGAVSEYSICVVQHDSIFHFCLPPLPPFFCLFMIF